MNIFTLPQTEEAAIQFLQTRNFTIKKICENGHEMELNIVKRMLWDCRKSACRKSIGLRVGNWLEGSKILCHGSSLHLFLGLRVYIWRLL